MTTIEDPETVRRSTASAIEASEALAGVILGTAVGDALGLPMEGLSARRQRALFPGPLQHRLIGDRGMLSDDTDHTMMVAQALLSDPSDAATFQRDLARQLRWWLASLPAGVGFATLRAILKLWLGFSLARSGVDSAGNGAAMRSAILGIYFASDPVVRRSFVEASTAITHRDLRARVAALAIAEVASWMTTGADEYDSLLTTLANLDPREEWASILSKLGEHLQQGRTTSAFAQAIGAEAGVSGYAYQSVPAAIYAALRHRDDFAQALCEAIACGGDTDTVGAMTGALVGARLGPASIPKTWRAGICDYPRSMDLLARIATRLAAQREAARPLGPVRFAWPLLPLRNLAFLGVVLAHGLRRLFPPY